MAVDVGAFEPFAVILAALVSILWQLFVVVLGVVIAWRWLHRPGGYATMRQGRQPTAFEILDAPYARGEIDAAEYEERRTLLLGDRGR